MKNIQAKLRGWARVSSKWSRVSSEAHPSAPRSGTIGHDLARASKSASRSSKFKPELIDPWTASPKTRPSAVGNPRVLLFPSVRAQRGEGEGSSGSRANEFGLKQARVLVVEDDFIVAYDMRAILEEQGATVLGPAASLEEARSLLATSTPNIAVLDVNLNGELVFPIAEELRARRIPYVFATAYADDERLFPDSARAAPRLAKPVLPNALIAQIERMLR